MLGYKEVRLCGLTKRFGPNVALAGINATFSAGEITSIEGPNGAGKSTLLGILALLLRPTAGFLRYGDWNPFDHPTAIRRTIGFLGHASFVYPDLSAMDNWLLHAQLFGLSTEAAKARIKVLRERLGLGDFIFRSTRTYSRGQLQRAALARALLHEPTLLLLDEPSSGLDSKGVELLIEALQEEQKRGAIVVMVTHDTELARRLSTKRLRLRAGGLEVQK
ncbi:MAG: ABC transporter ATP-binding protein [Deltaproteobacteria bacterium]|nr:ABC transporter ATP-binding protein [Deltaproteobacteria bacterium]